MKHLNLSALLCLGAGLLGFASGAYLALVGPVVTDERFSFPLDAAGFAAIQVWFAVQHLGLVAGLLALPRCGVLPVGRPARWGWLVAVSGALGLTITEVIAIAAADDTVDSGIAGVLGGLYGITCTAMGVGLTVAGVSIWRHGTWTGWRRGVVLALGVWVFVPMFPALVLTPTDGARWAIGGWMLLFAALGAALLHPATRPAPQPT